jgi:hypothetical protein
MSGPRIPDGPAAINADVAARVQALRADLIVSIRAHDPRDTQLAKADAYIAAIKDYATASKRRLSVPNRYAVLRQLG